MGVISFDEINRYTTCGLHEQRNVREKVRLLNILDKQLEQDLHTY